MGTKPRVELKDDAVPTLFTFNNKVEKRKSSEARREESKKKQLVEDALSSTSQIDDANDNDVIFDDDTLASDIVCSITESQIDDRDSSMCGVSEVATQTDISFAPQNDIVFYCTDDDNGLNPDEIPEEMSDSSQREDEMDDSYIPPSQDSQDSEDSQYSQDSEEWREPELNQFDGVKLIVFWSCLLPLLSFCRICRSDANIQNVSYFGFAVTVTLLCTSGHETTWASMPKINNMFAGNLLLPAAILFSGLTYTQFREVCDAIGLKCVGQRYFYKVQKSYLYPSIHKIYKTCRGIIIDKICQNRTSVDLSGDARCDSPGYNAKYSTYSLMDTSTNLIVHSFVTHVGHAGNSARMEKSGLISVLEKVESLAVKVRSLVTDRHQGVTKYLREEKKDILHQYDIWHFSKNIKKALVKAAKKKDCEIISAWIKAIINHFWWCCKSCGGSVHVLRERWMSLMFHISNKRRWVGYKHFKRCEHKKLKKREMKKKKWIKEGTPAYTGIEKIVKHKKTLKDLERCTEFQHSGNLEVFHSVYLKFCPKIIHFSLHGMIARTELAILHFNSAATAAYATNKLGKQMYKHQYSKITSSWVIKKVKKKSDREYVRELLKEVVWLRESNEHVPLPQIDVPKNIAPIEKPDKEYSIQSMKSRFK